MSLASRVAIAVAGVALAVAGWLDNDVMGGFRLSLSAFDNVTMSLLALSIGQLAIAGTVLLLAVVAWRSRSVLVGSLYAVVGSFFLFIRLITWLVGTQVNNSPPPAPSPIPEVLGRLSIWMSGPLDAVVMVGAGMVVGGLLVLGRQYRDRSAAPLSQPLPGVGAQPIRP